MMVAPTPEQLIAVMQALGYKVFTKGSYNLNIGGLRNTSAFDVEEYNDLIFCMYRETDDGPLIVRTWKGTTDPGRDARKRDHWDTAVLVPGQYLQSHRIGLHKGRRALVQEGPNPVTVYRCKPEDQWPFKDVRTDTGWFGINVHDMVNAQHKVVSEGCQGAQAERDHLELMDLAERGSKWGEFFSYTLLDWAEQ